MPNQKYDTFQVFKCLSAKYKHYLTSIVLLLSISFKYFFDKINMNVKQQSTRMHIKYFMNCKLKLKILSTIYYII